MTIHTCLVWVNNTSLTRALFPFQIYAGNYAQTSTRTGNAHACTCGWKMKDDLFTERGRYYPEFRTDLYV